MYTAVNLYINQATISNLRVDQFLVYVRDGIPSKDMKTFDIGVSNEGIFIELNFRKSKWLLLTAYMPPDVHKAKWFHNTTKISNEPSPIFMKDIVTE